jgi:hypothetical protein
MSNKNKVAYDLGVVALLKQAGVRPELQPALYAQIMGAKLAATPGQLGVVDAEVVGKAAKMPKAPSSAYRLGSRVGHAGLMGLLGAGAGGVLGGVNPDSTVGRGALTGAATGVGTSAGAQLGGLMAKRLARRSPLAALLTAVAAPVAGGATAYNLAKHKPTAVEKLKSKFASEKQAGPASLRAMLRAVLPFDNMNEAITAHSNLKRIFPDGLQRMGPRTKTPHGVFNTGLSGVHPMNNPETFEELTRRRKVHALKALLKTTGLGAAGTAGVMAMKEKQAHEKQAGRLLGTLAGKALPAASKGLGWLSKLIGRQGKKFVGGYGAATGGKAPAWMGNAAAAMARNPRTTGAAALGLGAGGLYLGNRESEPKMPSGMPYPQQMYPGYAHAGWY